MIGIQLVKNPVRQGLQSALGKGCQSLGVQRIRRQVHPRHRRGTLDAEKLLIRLVPSRDRRRCWALGQKIWALEQEFGLAEAGAAAQKSNSFPFDVPCPCQVNRDPVSVEKGSGFVNDGRQGLAAFGRQAARYLQYRLGGVGIKLDEDMQFMFHGSPKEEFLGALLSLCYKRRRPTLAGANREERTAASGIEVRPWRSFAH